MRIEIDQSIKIENTSKPTVLAFSNSKSDLIIISSREKKKIQKYFRQIGKPKLFAYLSFVALIYLLIGKCIKNRDQVVIDREYPGFEKFIKTKVKEFISENSKIREIDVSIGEIGKKSKAHLVAYSSVKKRAHKNIRKVFARDLIKIIKKNLKSGNA